MQTEVPADDGCRLWTEVAGDGPPLMFCHGGPGLWDTFGDVVDLLGAAIRTIRWDQRGGGRSQRRGPYSVARSIADLDAVREQLAGPRTALLGHSWGATLALRYALEHPDRVSALVYVSGTGIDPASTWHPAYRQNLAARLGPDRARFDELQARDTRTPDEERELAVIQWSADFADPTTARQHAEREATPWYPIAWDASATLNAEVKAHLAAENDLADRCGDLDIPVLVVDGTEDIRPRSAVNTLCAALPHARRVTLPGCGHSPWVEDPVAFRIAVSAFLAAAG
jgi:proline iminopeptidase